MGTYITTSSTRYSFSNANLVYNEDGIQVHKEDKFQASFSDQKEEQENNDEESAK